jgi:hypothetical protein
MVIAGKVTNHIYSWQESDSNAAHRLYAVKISTGRLMATGRVGNYAETSSEEVNPGECYTVSRGQFHHTSVAERSFSATLARTHTYDGNPLVIGEVSVQELYPFQRTELAKQQQERLLSELGRLHPL